MVAMISTGKDLAHVVRYNEKKVARGKARPLVAVNFGASIEALTKADKRKRLQRRAGLRPNVVQQRAVHISLGFDVSEKPDSGLLQKLSILYMERIGFAGQPYLVYEHLDAPHPHVHIVTTSIDKAGNRIPLNDIVRHISRQVTTGMEQEFDLVRVH